MNPLQGAGKIVPVICFLIFGSHSLSSLSWSPIGPGGGGWLTTITIVDDAAHTVYVGCDVGGIYKSTDNGRSWQIKNNGLTNYFVQDVAYDPQNSLTLYAATRGGVFKSIDGAETWVSKRSGFPEENSGHFSAPVSDIVVDPQSPNIVYAGIGVPRQGYILNSYHWDNDEVIKGTIYKSIDFGENWQPIHETGIPTEAMIYSLAIAPGDSKTLYAATSEGVYKSSDSGATWTEKNEGLPTLKRAMSLVVDPTKTNILYVTIWAKPGSNSWEGGVYKSEDGGQQWHAKNDGLPREMGSEEGMTSNYPVLVIDPNNPQVLYVGNNSWTPDPGVYKTIDGGEHWSWSSREDGDDQNVKLGWIDYGAAIKTLAIDPAKPARLYFGTSTDLVKTENGGTNWTQTYTHRNGEAWQGTGLETTCVQDVVIDPDDSSTIYAGYWDMGFLKSIDGGVSFKRTSADVKVGDEEYGANSFSIVVDPAAPSDIYATFGWWEENKGGVWKSSDRGESWVAARNGLPNATIWSIAMDTKSPKNARILYAASYNNGIYKTTNGGQNWIAVNNGLGERDDNFHNLQVRKIIVDPGNSSVLYAGIEAKEYSIGEDSYTIQGGIFKSVDAGKNWFRIDSKLPQLSVWDIVVDPGNSQTLYTAVSSVYDHSWNNHNGKSFYGGVFKSSDGGATWQKMSNGFGSRENLNVAALAISSANNHQTLYAATTDAPYHDNSSGRGIFKTIDGGAHWKPINQGLSVLIASSLTIDPSNQTVLYAGSGCNGILRAVDYSPAE